jgi:hypothetical protein
MKGAMKIPRAAEAKMMTGEGGGIDQAVGVQTTTKMMTIIITMIDVAEGIAGKDRMSA